MAGNKQYDGGAGKAGSHHPDTRGPDSLSGRSDPADPDTGQRQQADNGGSNAGHYTGAAGANSEREGGIVSAPPESNVGPAGAPQSDRGAHAHASGMTASGRTAAADGKPGTAAAGKGDGQGQSVDASATGTGVDELAKQTPDRPGGADSR